MIRDEAKKYKPLVPAIENVTGHRVHLSTAIRWCTRGISGCQLKTYWVGGRRLTSESDVVDFMDRVAEAKAGAIEDQQPAPTLIRREKEVAKAAEKLAAIVASKKPGRRKANT